MPARTRVHFARLIPLVAAVGSVAAHAFAQCQVAKTLAPDGAPGDLLGYSVALRANAMALGASGADNLETNSGAVYTLEFDAPGWSLPTEIVPPFGRGFGRAVSIDQNLLAIGAPGAAYAFVYERDANGAWLPAGQFRADDWESGDGFAWSIAISGNTVVVGSPYDHNANGADAGAAYVFERDPNGAWIQTQKLSASDGQSSAEFGVAVAIDAGTIAVGAWRQWISGYSYAGKAYVYDRDPNSGDWVERSALVPPESHSLQSFGQQVAIEAEHVFVGAEGDWTIGPTTGAVYVYDREANGLWRYAQTLYPGDVVTSQFFGAAICIDRNAAIVGADGDDTMATVAGAAYVFVRETDGVWHQHTKFTASDGQYYDRFGWSVALDGSWTVIGALYDDDNGNDSGSAYIFRVGPDYSGNGVPDICECPGDIDYSGAVGLSDLSALLTNFGLAAGQSYESGDIDGDYDVDLADLSALLERYGVECP